MNPIRSQIFKVFFSYLFVVFLLLAAITAGPAYFLVSDTQRQLSSRFIDQSAEQAVGSFDEFFTTAEETLQMIGHWSESGLLSLEDFEEVNQLLFPVLEDGHLNFGVSILDNDGNSYHIDYSEGLFETTRVDLSMNETLPFQAQVQQWKEQVLLDESIQQMEEDPRKSQWYLHALSADGVYWSDPYIFPQHRIAGVTVAQSMKTNVEGSELVVALDLSIHDIFENIRRLQPSPNSRVSVIRNDATLYDEASEGGATFLSLAGLKDQLIAQAHSAWLAGNSDDRVVSVEFEGQVWWCGFRAVDAARGRIWVSVMVPEEDTLEGVGKRRNLLLGSGFTVILMSAGISFLLTRRKLKNRSSVQFPSIPLEPDSLREWLQKVVDGGESKRSEFKSTMRMNLRAGKPGKEIETAWLKGVAAFLNTDGGILLLGVSDDGEILGLEADNFRNEDHCQLHFKNLISQQIGAQFSKDIEFRTVWIDDKMVGIIECRRSSEPVFLKHAKGESFFIRNGPSSDELPVSQVVEYIRTRK